jgi:hypothetical protein
MKSQLPTFYFDELAERFKSGPVPFRLVVQLAANVDPVVDASQAWPVCSVLSSHCYRSTETEDQ